MLEVRLAGEEGGSIPMLHRLEERGLGTDRRDDRGVPPGVTLVPWWDLEDRSMKSVDTSMAHDELLFPSWLLFTDPPNKFRLISSLPWLP